MEDFLMLMLCSSFTAVGVWGMRRVWKSEESPYRIGTFMATMVGENGRYGYDATVSLSWIFFLILTIGASVFNWPLEGTQIAEVIRSLVIPLLLFSIAVLLSVLFFLRPRFLVPPHLRDKRGWIPEWIHSMRNRRSG